MHIWKGMEEWKSNMRKSMVWMVEVVYLCYHECANVSSAQKFPCHSFPFHLGWGNSACRTWNKCTQNVTLLQKPVTNVLTTSRCIAGSPNRQQQHVQHEARDVRKDPLKTKNLICGAMREAASGKQNPALTIISIPAQGCSTTYLSIIMCNSMARHFAWFKKNVSCALFGSL